MCFSGLGVIPVRGGSALRNKDIIRARKNFDRIHVLFDGAITCRAPATCPRDGCRTLGDDGGNRYRVRRGGLAVLRHRLLSVSGTESIAFIVI